MKNTDLIHGFQLIQSREIAEIKATAHRYLHQKSGAELLFLQCEDDNKAFNIGFKTIPEDDTGCPHILEHSVLNGSEQFPAKGTFMELVKGSLNTFINALTSSDWTTYPVASTNDKDFMNLMKVYLDAVLKPNVYNEPRILDQEGWHYELFDVNDEINYRGVVYNEMKGAFSSVDSIVERYCTHTQFPDTPYGFESGGDPMAIPQLTHEKFLAFHTKYYDPSNSKIYLYGNLNIDAALKLIDEDYLCHYSNPGIKIDIPLQVPFTEPKILSYQYPAPEDQDIKNQYYLALNYTYGKVTNPHLSSSLSLLSHLLMNSPASPLKTAIRNSGLCMDSMLSVNDDILQPTLSIVCKQMRQEDIPALTELIVNELKRIAKDGFDKKLIEASINYHEFLLREAQMQRLPKGLYYCLKSFGLWMNGGDPLSEIAFEGYLIEMRKGLTEPYFEALIEKVFLQNTHSSVITFIPVPGLIAQQEQIVKEELAAYKKSLSPNELQALVAKCQDLKAWQEKPDSKEDIEKIPLLTLDDVDREITPLPIEKEVWKEFTLLKHPINTNGIVYLKAFFDLAHATEDDLPWLKLYTQLLGQVNSENYTFAELYNEIQCHTGAINLNVDILNSFQTPDEIIPKLILSGKAVKDKSDKLMELAAEYAFMPKFDDPQRIKTLVKELKSRAEAASIQNGLGVAITRMFAPFSQSHDWQDRTSGLAYYQFLTELESRLDDDIADIIDTLNWVKTNFFNTQNLIISLTANEEIIPEVFAKLGVLLLKASTTEREANPHQFTTRIINEGIAAPVKVQYVVKGGNFFRKGYSYSGRLRVLSNILSNEFLYKELRVKGGAYGGGAGFTLDGYQYFYSYRDPNLLESLKVYDSVPDFIREFQCSKREMDKYILGEISAMDFPKTPEAKGYQADLAYITGFTDSDRQQIRDEVLSTQLEDLRIYADMIALIMDKNHFSVFGNEAKLKANAEIFTQITPLIKK